MCGICGIAASDPRRVPLDAGRLRAMTDSLRHRGPDDRGELNEPGISLGMRRLFRENCIAVAARRADAPGNRLSANHVGGNSVALFVR